MANGNPYVGPRPFDTQPLFGRSREVMELKYLLTSERIVLLYSPSGAGKSSLVQAGLIPEVADRFDVWGPTRVNLEPPPGVRNRYTWSALAGFDRSQAIHPEMRMEEYVARRRGELNPLLVFDQFEEILRIDPVDTAQKRHFFLELGELLKSDPGLWALFVLREDYLAPFDPYSRLIPTHFQNRYRIDRLNRRAAAEAIEGPTAETGRKFAPGAVDYLVENLAKVKIQELDGTLREEAGQYVEPLQLQVVCFDIWERMRPDDERIDVEDIGDVDTALKGYYDGAVLKIAGEDWALQRSIREWFQFRLITPDGLRNQVRQEAAQSGGLPNALVAKIVDTYLVRAEPRGVTWFELAHDRLVAPVRECNGIWLERSDRELQQVYDEAVKEAAQGDHDRERKLRDWFQQLAGGQAVPIPDEGATGHLWMSRLLDGRAPDFTLRHPCLEKLIPERNRAFVERQAGSLRDRALAWEARGKPNWMLARGSELEEFRKWDGDALLLAVEKEYLTRSIRQCEEETQKAETLEKERRQAKITEKYLRWTAAFALVAVIAVVYAVKKRYEAKGAENEARRLQAVAESVRAESAERIRSLTELANRAVSDGLSTTAPTPSGGLPPNACAVYIHVRREAPEQRKTAEEMRQRLRTLNCEAPGIEALTVGPADREFRYFRASQKAGAERIAAALGGQMHLRYIGRFEKSGSKAVPYQFEIWFEQPSRQVVQALVAQVAKAQPQTAQSAIAPLVADYSGSSDAVEETLRVLGKGTDAQATANAFYFLQNTDASAWTEANILRTRKFIEQMANQGYYGDSHLRERADALQKTLEAVSEQRKK